MSVICFDTHLLIWGVQKSARAHQAHMVDRTRRFLEHLSEQNDRIMVPVPVLQEYLLGVPREDQPEHRRIIEESFFVPALDLPAGVLAAELEGDCQQIQQLREKHGRQRLRVDAQILAIAIVQGADRVITNDSHLSVLAQGKIDVQGVPDIPRQTKMWEDRNQG